MKKILKIFKKIVIGFVILIVVVMIGGFIAIKVVVTKDFVATKIEQNINGRVEIGDISVPIWAAFSGVTVDNFKIGYRDAEVTKPMKERAPLKNEVIGFKKFNFQVALGALITSFGKKLELKSLLFTEPKAHIVLGKNGGNNLKPLLMKPLTKEEAANAKLKSAEEKAAAAKKAAEAKAKGPDKPFDIREYPTQIKMGKIGIEGGYFTVAVESLGQTLVVSGANIFARDILIDPKDLEHKNHVGLTAQFNLELKESKGGGVKSFKIIFDTQGGLTPIDPKTGGPAQAVTLRTGLRKGSYVTGLSIFNKLKDKTEMLNRAGIQLGFLADTQTLAKDAMTTINYAGGVVTVVEPPALITNDFEFRLSKGDYINVKNLDHHFRGDFSLASKHTKEIEATLDKNIATAVNPAVDKVPAGTVRDQIKLSLAPDKVRSEILAPAMKNGLVTLGVDSSATISSPNVRVVAPQFPSLNDLIDAKIKSAGGDIGNLISGQADALKNEGKAKIDAAKKQAEDAAKKQASDAIQKNLPSIPGF
ncbi:MAG: hypothetical protein JSR44_15825 [Spirochaetes bacterium]|nr:hypothetical protein [Spirochaetota bacterium]